MSEESQTALQEHLSLDHLCLLISLIFQTPVTQFIRFLSNVWGAEPSQNNPGFIIIIIRIIVPDFKMQLKC